MPSQHPWRKIEVTICNYQADNPLYVWPDVCIWWFASLEKYDHTWHRMSLMRPGVIKQTQTQPSVSGYDGIGVV